MGGDSAQPQGFGDIPAIHDAPGGDDRQRDRLENGRYELSHGDQGVLEAADEGAAMGACLAALGRDGAQ